MIIYAEVECMMYEGRSLKNKRSVLKRLLSKLQNNFNVAVAELDYQDLWQRMKIGIVTVSENADHGEQIIQAAIREIDSLFELERTITNIERR